MCLNTIQIDVRGRVNIIFNINISGMTLFHTIRMSVGGETKNEFFSSNVSKTFRHSGKILSRVQ